MTRGGQDHARTPQRIHHDLDKIFLQGMVKDLDQHPRVRAPERSSQDCQKKDLLLLEGILQDLETRASQEHPRRVSTRELPTHGICKISMPGPFREDLTRIAKKFF